MSTVGKVLCALIALPTLGWIWLAANIAEFNRAYGKIHNTTVASIAASGEELGKTKSDIVRARANISLVESEKESRLTSARSLISQLYRENSSSKETLDRYTLQFDNARAAEKAAETRKSQTRDLLTRTERELAAARTDLAQIKDVNRADRDTLEQLRQELQQTLAQNREMVQDRLREATPAARPAARREQPEAAAAVTR